MAPTRTKVQIPVGSAQWILDEREQLTKFDEQEVEDFTFSARNELEWLNEHMAEIFSSNGVNVTEIFKTPGKLRGKTPRTTRKRKPLETRAPLTDIFSADAQLSANATNGPNVHERFSIPQMLEQEGAIATVSKDNNGRVAKKTFDSGYHEMTEDEMDADPVPPQIEVIQEQLPEPQPMTIDPPEPQQRQTERQSEERRTTEGSFHSAKEDLASKEITAHPARKELEGQPAIQDQSNTNEILTTTEAPELNDIDMPDVQMSAMLPTSSAHDSTNEDKESLLDDENDFGTSHTPSDASSPVKPVVRKSSLTFAALPAREPLTTKKSIGARVSRTSQLDQAKSTAISRSSYFGRYTGGKSLGGLRQPDHGNQTEEGAMELDDEDKPRLTREESDGDGKMARLHNKSSTQRLHDRINMLGQTQPARSTKSIPAIAPATQQPNYPDLPKANMKQTRALERDTETIASKIATELSDDDDDDDWIKPPTKEKGGISRPQMVKSRSVDVMEQIDGKDSIGGEDFGLGPLERETIRQGSPLRIHDTNRLSTAPIVHRRSASLSAPTSPKMPPPSKGVYQKHAVSVSNPSVPLVPSTTPAGNPQIKNHHDGPLSASKSKLQSIMKSARGLFTSSAGVSAQAKMETLSPSSMKTRSKAKVNDAGGLGDKVACSSNLSHALYPEIPKETQISISKDEAMTEGRKTRSSTEKEGRIKEKETKEKQQLEQELERVQIQEQQKEKVSLLKTQKANVSAKATPKSDYEVPSIPPRPTRQSPRRLRNQDKAEVSPETAGLLLANPSSNEAVETSVEAPVPTAHSQNHTSHLQKPKDLRRPIKPSRETAPKPKPQPVSIRVGTLSQRIPLTNAALASSLQDSLPPPQAKQSTLVKKPSTASLQTSTSNTSFKGSVASAVTKPKALIAAERKKEQDEKEALRKQEQKREIGLKRAAQQEEALRRERQQIQEAEKQREKERSAANEDPKKVAQKQAIEKRRLELKQKDQQRNPQRPINDLAYVLQQDKSHATAPPQRPELGGNRVPSRLNTLQDFPQAPTNHPASNATKPPTKRVFEPDNDDELSKPIRIPGGPVSQHHDAKRRKTDEEEVRDVPVRHITEPPIRQSNIHKNAPKSSIFANQYPIAPPPPANHHAGPSLVKSTIINQAYQQHPYHNQGNRPAHPVEMAQYTKGKIPFGETPNPPQSYKTPLPSKQKMAPSKQSPVTNTDHIHLEEPQTDSEEEDSEEERKKKRNLPEWALTPEIRRALIDQEDIDTDALFGPPQAPNMEEMFKVKDKRFRSRTSSANWGGQDRLTEEDIRNDLAARDRMRRDGGWTYGI